jgi:hypothetical protein
MVLEPVGELANAKDRSTAEQEVRRHLQSKRFGGRDICRRWAARLGASRLYNLADYTLRRTCGIMDKSAVGDSMVGSVASAARPKQKSKASGACQESRVENEESKRR